MEYPKKSVNGDAGEYLVAYKITKMFGWPCRLLGVDIGVDAETEIMEPNASSSGNVIKIQIKSFDSISGTTSQNIYVDERHIDYWKRFCLPVIVCCVDLKQEKIYWKQISSTDTYKSEGESMRISIDLNLDELRPHSEAALRSLAIPEDSKQIEKLLNSAREIHKGLSKSAILCIDTDDLESIKGDCDEIDNLISQIENLISHFPWRASTMALQELSSIKQSVVSVRNKAQHSYANNFNNN